MSSGLRRAATVLTAVTIMAGCADTAHPVRHGSQALGAAERRLLATRYLVIAKAGNRRLEADFTGLEGRHARNLAAARADLADAAATEHRFDQQLLAIRFPPPIEAVARLLVYLNESRSQLTRRAATARTLPELRAAERMLRAANVPVEQEVSMIRQQLGLPPPSTS
jgi:hypothetical protein